MKEGKKSLIFFILSLIITVSSVFAFFNISKITDVDYIGGNVADYANLATFYVMRKNETEFIEIKDIIDMHNVFGDTRPGEEYLFKIEFINTTVDDREIFLELKDIMTNYFSTETEDYDLRDVFYILNGEVNLSFYNLDEELVEEKDPFILNTLSTDEVIKHNQTLNKYRLNNLLANDNRIMLTPQISVSKDLKASVTFRLIYDINTSNILYQNNQLSFNGIYIYAQ